MPLISNPAVRLNPPLTTAKAPRKYFVGIFLGQFGLIIALLAPVMVSMQLKVQELAPENPAGLLGAVLPFGALGALFANPLAGMLSDRTRTRWGRRRPWLLGGVIGLALGLAFVAFAQDQLSLTVAWVLCQVAANATLAAMIASFADNVPEFQRGTGSSVIAIAQNAAILAGTYLAAFLVGNLPMLFIAPGILAVLLVLAYTFLMRDDLPEEKPAPLKLTTILGSFWTNPIKNADYGFAWWSRFLIVLATFMFTTYRLLYMQQHLGIQDAGEATAAVALGVMFYTAALLLSTTVSGWLSDKLGRRKIFVGGSTLIFGIGLVILAQAQSVQTFYVAEVIMGLAYGVYTAVDQALVIDVLPDPEHPGKDLGVLNIANALPQSIAPALALFFLGIGAANNTNYTAMLWAAGLVAAAGAFMIIPIKRVR
ncbi:MFS transporter [Paeniglutamicibacter sp. NPDC012692]|uniref:MFS transporter n=1 Tax=Paeniglutamicibacter sp. NPDC012692 TaxID=3364388 RepID=UPI0036C882BC